MKIEFDWKKFEELKPVEDTKIIFKVVKNGKPYLYIGTFVGIFDTVGVSDSSYVFNGGKIMTNSLSKKNTQKLSFTFKECNEIEWDSYNENWV